MSLATEQAFVTGAYANILFRSAANLVTASTQADINSWAALINDGAITEFQAATDIANTVEATTNVLPIVSLYEDLLHRNPSGQEIAFYVGELQAGTPLVTVASQFTASPEFSALYGAHPSNNAFVTQLYSTVLGRAPEAGALTYYNALLGGSGSGATPAEMAAVALDFTTSPEALLDTSANIRSWLVGGSGGTYAANFGPVYSLTNGGATTASEGTVVTFHLATQNVAPGTALAYTLSGVPAFDVVGGLTGTVTVGVDGTATLPVVLNSTPGLGLSGSLTATLNAPNVTSASSVAASVSLTETASGIPIYTLSDAVTGGSSYATEGSTVIFHVATINVAAGSAVSYNLSGVTANQVAGGLLTGTAIVSTDGTANISVTLRNIPGNNLGSTLTASLVLPANAGPTSVASASVPLDETAAQAGPPAPSYAVTEAVSGGASSATESSIVTFHVATNNVSAGTTLNYTLTGVTSGQIVGGQLSGTVVVASDGTANIPVTLTSVTGAGLSGNLTATLTAAGATVGSASVPLTESSGTALIIPTGGGGVITQTTSDTGGVVVGTPGGTAGGGGEPALGVTITDLAATGQVQVYGGQAVTVTTFSTGGVVIGTAAGTVGSEPGGGVTVTDDAISGAVNVYGGAAVTVTTASASGVTVGTALGTAGTEPTGGINITDSAAVGALHLYGGAAVTVTTASGDPITIGVAGVAAADPVGNVTVTNLITDPTTHLVSFGAATATINTNGANTVTITGTSVDVIADAAGSAITAHLANIILDGVGGTNVITTGWQPIITLSVLDGAANSSETVIGSSAHTMALTVGSTAYSTVATYATVTDATATSVTVTDSGSLPEHLSLNAVSATTVILGAHTGPTSLLLGTVLAGATTASTSVTGLAIGDSLHFADTATSVYTTTVGQQAVIAGATLAVAIATVDAYATTTAHSVTVFQNGGVTYALESVAAGTGTLQAGDSLIALVGTHSLSAPTGGLFTLLS